MKQYKELLEHVLTNGKFKQDRTGVGCYSVFGYQNRYDLNDGFPIVTTKKVLFDKVVDELLWFLSGSMDLNDLPERSQCLWKPWADEDGHLGLIYSQQWRNSGKDRWHKDGVDQIANVIDSLKEKPDSRRHIVSSWVPEYIEHMNLPPCHCLFQFFVEDEKLSCQLYQRSADAFLGVPFNISSYALLTHMIAQVCGYGVGEFIHSFGDLHLYSNHVEQAKLQLSRIPLQLPKLWLNPDIKDIDDFKFEDIRLEGYEHHPFIKAEVAV